MKTQRTIVVLSLLAPALMFCDQSIAQRPPSTQRADSPRPSRAATQPVGNRTLTLAWNRQTYEVPEPVVIPDGMKASRAYQQWWPIGDIRTLEWTDENGRRYVAEALCKLRDKDGQVKAVTPYVSRYRADGTLEAKSFIDPGGLPEEWSIFAADGKTKTIGVVNRLHGLPGTPFIEYVTFYAADGKEQRKYQANRHGVVYLEWFYDAKGDIARWNGSSKFDGPVGGER